MLIIIFTALLIFGFTIYFLGPKDFWDNGFLEIVVSRTSFSLLISIAVLGICFVNFFYFHDPFTESSIRTYIDILLGIPMAIPFLFGFTEGAAYAFIAMGVELLLLTVFIRLFIPKRWPENVKRKIKKLLK
ncbi:MAG: hypothetical protein ABR574_13555 [Cryomorphaceae bacterium]